MAAFEGHLGIVWMLLESGGQLNEESEEGFTPVLAAASNGYTEVVNFLIRQGAEAESVPMEFTPITYGGPEAFSPAQRQELRHRLHGFKVVTVHSSGMDGANICSAAAEAAQAAALRLSGATITQDEAEEAVAAILAEGS